MNTPTSRRLMNTPLTINTSISVYGIEYITISSPALALVSRGDEESLGGEHAYANRAAIAAAILSDSQLELI